MHRIISKREKMLLAATISLVIFVAGFNFFIAPVLDKSHALNKEIGLARVKLAKYRRLLGQREQIQAKFGALLSSVNNAGPVSPDASLNILSELENIARNASIRIIEIRPQAYSGEALIDLRTEGAITGYIKFLYDIENSLFLLGVRKFQLNARPNSQALEGAFSISQLSLTE